MIEVKKSTHKRVYSVKFVDNKFKRPPEIIRHEWHSPCGLYLASVDLPKPFVDRQWYGQIDCGDQDSLKQPPVQESRPHEAEGRMGVRTRTTEGGSER